MAKDWLDGFHENKGPAKLVTYDGVNLKDASGNSISVSGSGESNTATGVGAGGVAIVNGKVGVDLQFRNVIAGSNKATVTLDAPNKEIEIDVVEANLNIGNMGGVVDLGGAQASGTLAAARTPAYSGGDVSSSAGSLTLSIGANKVTNTLLNDMAADTVKVNNTGSASDPTDLGVAINTIIGRGPTGHIDDLAVQAGLVITNTTLGRAAITGDVSIGQDTNTSVIGSDKVVTAMVLNNNITDAKLSTMATKTIKGNPTASTANAQNMTISGGLTMTTGSPGSVSSKGSISFPATFSTNTTMSDPLAEGVKFNHATLGSVTAIAISSSLGGRNIRTLLATLAGGQVSFMSNHSASTAFAIFNVTAVDDNTSGDYYTLTATPVSGLGALPANGEGVLFYYSVAGGAGLTTQDVLDMEVVRLDANGLLINKVGTVISGSPSVADQAALIALDAADYDGFAVNVQSGMNNSFHVSNGAAFAPLNGQYVHSRVVIDGNWYIGANNVTWTTANVGGKVQITASGVHGLTTTPAAGSYLYLISGGAGWTAGTSHLIESITSTTVIQLSTAYSGHTGVPVFARAGTVTASSEIPHRAVTLPIMRDTTEVETCWEVEYAGTVNATDSKVMRFYLATTMLNSHSSTAANKFFPLRHGFVNKSNVAIQRALAGENSTGYAVSTLIPLTATVNTGVSQTATLATMVETVNVAVRINSSRTFIRG